MPHNPRNGERVHDTSGGNNRWGTIVGFEYIRDDRYVKVDFEGRPPNLEPEQFEEYSFFNDDGNENGRWDDERKCWCLEDPHDALPMDDPFVVSFNKSIQKMNDDLVRERVGKDTLARGADHLRQLAKEAREEADRLGNRNPYFNFYDGKAKDWARAAELVEQENV